MPNIRFVLLPPPALTALIEDDLATASAVAGVELSPFLVEEAWLWRIRRDDVARDPAAGEWIARAALDADTAVVIGHGGFHGPPDEDGTVEIGYTVAPRFRRRGYGRAMVTALLARAAADPRVHAVRASIRPDNVASLATIARFGFRKVGEQWDPEDGLELVFRRSV